MKKALIVVDVQNDFMPEGALSVPDSDRIIPLINKLIPEFEFIVATKDWHPGNHGSFASNHSGKKVGDIVDLAGIKQFLWPEHCIQNTKGSEFYEELNISGINAVFEKGTNPMVDSYSGFFDNGRKQSTGLDDYLKKYGIKQVYIVGVATDYCVKFTALDAVVLGYETFLIVDGCSGVNINIGDVDNAIDEMRKYNVKCTTSSEILF